MGELRPVRQWREEASEDQSHEERMEKKVSVSPYSSSPKQNDQLEDGPHSKRKYFFSLKFTFKVKKKKKKATFSNQDNCESPKTCVSEMFCIITFLLVKFNKHQLLKQKRK